MNNQNGVVLVDKLSEEINHLEQVANNTEKSNKKRARIRKVKVFGTFIAMILPYLASLGLCFGAFCAMGDIPFVRQEELKVNCYTENFDNKGLNDVQSVYRPDDSNYGSAEYASKWEQKADGRYYRTTKKYDFDCQKVKLGALKEAINNNKDLDGLLGQPKSSKLEVKKELTEEDIKNDGYIKVLFKYKDKDDFIMEAQDLGDNIGKGVVFIFMGLLGCGITMVATIELGYADYIIDKFEEIDHDYAPIDTSDLRATIEEKKALCKKLGVKNDICNTPTVNTQASKKADNHDKDEDICNNK